MIANSVKRSAALTTASTLVPIGWLAMPHSVRRCSAAAQLCAGSSDSVEVAR